LILQKLIYRYGSGGPLSSGAVKANKKGPHARRAAARRPADTRARDGSLINKVVIRLFRELEVHLT
jgi:hypothetical protein